MENKESYIFIDNGSDTMKCAQYSTNIYHDFDYFEIPQLLLPYLSVSNQIQFNKTRLDMKQNEIIAKEYFDKSKIQKQPLLYQGMIQDLDSIENIWNQVIEAFTNVEQTNKTINLLMSEPSINLEERIEQREQITEMAFEKLNCSSFTFIPQSSLKLFANLQFSGVVVDFGADLTQISPVDNGYTSFHSSSQFKVTGSQIDKFLLNLLSIGNGIQLPQKPSLLHMLKRDLKEQQCNENQYRLPDKTILQLDKDSGYDRESLAYLYFNSDIIKEMYQKNDSQSNSCYQKFFNTINQVALASQEDYILERKSIVYKILKNLHNYTSEENVSKNSIETVLLTGGSLQLSNLGNLIQHQLEARCIDEFPKLGIVQQKQPRTSILQGAKIYCSMKHLQSILINKSEYEEEGKNIINRKCF